MKKTLLSLAMAAMAMVTLQAQTVWNIIEGSEDHNTLEAAVLAAELDGALNNPDATLTVFAPTDAAFAALEAAVPGIIDDLLAEPAGLLTDVLLYHVVGSVALSTDLTDQQVLETLLEGQSVTVTIDGTTVLINQATVTTPDLAADNGVVHVIDAVLLPAEEDPTIWDIVDGSEVHTTLAAAIDAAGLVAALDNPEGDFTLFAPTDAAFEVLGGAVADLLADPDGALVNVLLYHLVLGTALSTDLSDGLEILTAQGETVTVAIDGSTVTINGAEVTIPDLEASNGVVHVLDAVLLPELCTIFAGGPYIDFNNAGGAPQPDADGNCEPIVLGFEAWASEAYIVEGFLADQEYTFSICDGEGAGSWDPVLIIQNAATGAVIASAEDCQITWTTSTDDDLFIIIQEAGFCGGQSNNTGEGGENGNPTLTCGQLLPETVVDIIVNSEIHTTLATAVNAAGLVETLQGEGPFTVFAPTDEAFGNVDPATLDALLGDPTGLLTDVLTYHVAAGLVLSGDLTEGQIVTTIFGEELTIGVTMDGVTVGNTSVTADVIVPDLLAQNGVVHVINEVLVPTTLNVEDVQGLNGLNIFPNPTNNMFSVDFDLTEANRVTIDVVSLVGQQVKRIDLGMLSSGRYLEMINVSNLPAGFYLMNITVGESQIVQKVQVTK